MIGPIKPEEITEKKKQFIPDEVIEIFNSMIVEKWTGSSATIKQKEVVNRIVDKLDINKSYIYDNHYLDIEDIFRNVGWKVIYDKPAYCEDYDAYFEFRK